MQKINKFKEDFHKKFCSWNCPIWFKNMQSFLQIIVNAKVFEIFIVMCIIVNTIFLAADHHDADDNLKNALSIGNSGLSSLSCWKFGNRYSLPLVFGLIFGQQYNRRFPTRFADWAPAPNLRIKFMTEKVNHRVTWLDRNIVFSFHLHLCSWSLSQNLGARFHYILERSMEHIRLRYCHHFNLRRFYLAYLTDGREPELWFECTPNAQGRFNEFPERIYHRLIILVPK